MNLTSSCRSFSEGDLKSVYQGDSGAVEDWTQNAVRDQELSEIRSFILNKNNGRRGFNARETRGRQPWLPAEAIEWSDEEVEVSDSSWDWSLTGEGGKEDWKLTEEADWR